MIRREFLRVAGAAAGAAVAGVDILAAREFEKQWECDVPKLAPCESVSKLKIAIFTTEVGGGLTFYAGTLPITFGQSELPDGRHFFRAVPEAERRFKNLEIECQRVEWDDIKPGDTIYQQDNDECGALDGSLYVVKDHLGECVTCYADMQMFQFSDKP